MAAVTITKGKALDSKKMFSHVASYLPAYAQPRFIRIQVTILTFCSEFHMMRAINHCIPIFPSVISHSMGCKKMH